MTLISDVLCKKFTDLQFSLNWHEESVDKYSKLGSNSRSHFPYSGKAARDPGRTLERAKSDRRRRGGKLQAGEPFSSPSRAHNCGPTSHNPSASNLTPLNRRRRPPTPPCSHEHPSPSLQELTRETRPSWLPQSRPSTRRSAPTRRWTTSAQHVRSTSGTSWEALLWSQRVFKTISHTISGSISELDSPNTHTNEKARMLRMRIPKETIADPNPRPQISGVPPQTSVSLWPPSPT